MTVDSVIAISPHEYDALIEHLLSGETGTEEAAFLFARCDTAAARTRLRVMDFHLVQPAEFHIRTDGHLNLRHSAHERMIKHAHELGAAIVEVHSHPYHFEGAACFSVSDRRGLADVVPHVMWRLPDRPYTAVVVAPQGLDALIWNDRMGEPCTLDALLVGDRRIIPTGETMRRGLRFHGSF